MSMNRRHFLKGSSSATVMALAASAGLLKMDPALASTWNENAFKAKNLSETVKALGGQTATESKDITITSPDIAENGAVVPVSVSSKLPNVESVSILVEKNPNSLAASFNIPPGTEAFVSTRVKMGQTSNVHAVVKAGGQYYYTTKEVKVTLGGCGG